MALDRNFTGFEGGQRDPFSSLSNLIWVSAGNARSGEWHGAMNVPAAAVNSGSAAWPTPTAGQSIADNNAARGRFRAYFRLRSIPSGTDVKLFGFGAGNVQNSAGLLIRSAGNVAAHASLTTGSYSGAALSVGVWYRAELELLTTNPPAGSSTAVVTINVYDETGATLIATVTSSGTASATPSIPAANIGHSDANSSTFEVDYDDLVWVIEDNGAATLPTATRVTRVDATAQGANAGWTGDYRLVADVPRDTGTDEQTVTTNGATTTFAHASAAALGLGAIEAIRIYGALKAASGGADALMLNGVEFAVTTPTAYGAQALTGLDWTSYSEAAFNAMEFGARNKRGVSLQLGMCYLEVLHDAATNAFATLIAGTGTWKHKIIQYTGTGAFQTISGVGFRPQVILTKKSGGTGTNVSALKLASMGGTVSKNLVASTLDENAIRKITDDGFELGTDAVANESGAIFEALCIADGGEHPTAGHFMRSGSWLGNGLDNFDVTIAAGFQADWILAGIATLARVRNSGHVGDTCTPLSSSATVTDQIQSIGANGFQVGATGNTSANVIPYVAIRLGAGGALDAFFDFGSLVAAGTAESVATPFAPEFVAVKRIAAQDAQWRGASIAAHAGLISTIWSGVSTNSTGITALSATGFSIGSSLAQAGQTTDWFAFSISGEVPLGEVEFGGDEDNSGATIGLHWIHFFDKAGTEHVWSKLFLADPASYYGGPKEDRVIRFGLVKRALSDPRGEYEGTTFSWVLSDTDRTLRGLLANLATKWIKGRNVIMRSISDVARRALDTPRTIVRGIAMSARPVSPLHFEMAAQDWFAAKFTVGKSEQQIPRRTITAADFPNCPAGTIGRTVPIIYGNLSDQNDQSYTVPGTPGSAPTVGLSKPQVTATVVGGAGSATRRYCVTALDNRGNQHNDFAQNANHAGETDGDIVTVSGAPDDGELSSTRYIQLTWPDVPGAFYYRIYGRYPDFDLCFLDSADFGDPEYHDGERNGRTEIDVLKTDSHPPSANGTVVGGNPGTPESTITTDTGAGAVPVIYVGLREVSGANWHEFLVCGHAVKAITGWYGGGVRFPNTTEGVDFLIPGFGGYTAAVGAATYREFNGHRYTVIYARGPNGDRGADGSSAITLNVQGIEETGDGTGALITDVIQQYKHALKNWLVGDYQAGAWLASPAFDDEPTLAKIDEDSFDTASAAAAVRIPGGYPGAMIIGADGEQASLREMIARFNLNCDVNSGFNRKTQFAVFMESDEVSILAAAITLTQTREIFAESFEIEDQDDRHENVVPYSYAYDYRNKKWGTETEVRDTESITNYEVELLAERVLLHFIRVAAVSDDISRRRLARSADPPRLARFTVGLLGLSIELGQVVLIVHGDGVGSSGWNLVPVRIVRHEFDPDGYSVRLEGYDSTRVFNGAFILGDETALPLLWTSASATQKRYGYLGDETTEQFSDGTAIKRLR